MKKVILVAAGKLIISIVSILLLRVYSDNLSLAEIGIITLLLNFDSFFGLVYASPFGNYLSLTALSDLRNKASGQKVLDYVSITFLFSLLSFFIFLAYERFFDLNFTISISLIFILYLFLNNSTPIISSLLLVINKTEASILLQVIKSLSALISFLIIFYFVRGAEGWIIGSFIGILLPVVFGLIFFKKTFYSGKVGLLNFRNFIGKDFFLKYILPYALMQLILWFFFNSYRVYAGKLYNLDFLGELALAFAFASQFCSAFDSVISQIYQADFYRLIDKVSENKKLENFGLFLKEVQPVYLIFLVVGFLPFIACFQLVLKPKFSIDIMVLLTAWIFNFIRISFNLFGLITQVTLRPKVVTKHVLTGVVLSIIIFSGMYYFKVEISRNVFLMITGFIPVGVLSVFIYSIGKRVHKIPMISKFFLVFISSIVIYFFLARFDLLVTAIKSNQVTVAVISCVVLAILGLKLLSLPKKLKAL